MIPAHVVETLVRIGNDPVTETPEIAALLDTLRPYSGINREHWSTWDQTTEHMSTESLVALARGLTLAERYLRWNGGSVAAVIWVFRQIQQRDNELANKAADWILPRTRNMYVPYGRQNRGAQSAEEYRRATRVREVKIEAGIVSEQESETRAAVERSVRERQRHKASVDRNTVVRTRFLEDLRRRTTVEQLLLLANDDVYSAEFYPTCLADAATNDVISTLDEQMKIRLLTKLKGKKRGPWRSFKRRLLSTMSKTPWDREKWFH